MLSIVIPVLNEGKTIRSTLQSLNKIISHGDEIIVVDGQSEDETREVVASYRNVKLIVSQQGRARQMNEGARLAKGKYILFLHADTELSHEGIGLLKRTISSSDVPWGWFKLELDSKKLKYKLLTMASMLRARMTKTPLGDHGIFVKTEIFHKIGGFPEIPIMEDLEFARKIKGISGGVEIKAPIKVSVRRFEKNGILTTLLQMWVLRTLYYFGMSASTLAKYYDNAR